MKTPTFILVLAGLAALARPAAHDHTLISPVSYLFSPPGR
jgi:hypothetical protein